MRYAWIPLALAAGVAACNGRTGRETAHERSATDTVVTQRPVQDTTIVTHDTTVKVDTTVRRGAGRAGAPRDTVRDTRGKASGRTSTDTTRPR